MSKTKNQVIDQQNDKQQAIRHLTDLMATIQGYHYKRDAWHDCPLRVHESSQEDCMGISIDLYHFEGDGKPVVDGLDPCIVTFDDGTELAGHLFCMHYDPDEPVTPLVFLFTPANDADNDLDIDPEDVPTHLLHSIAAWLEQQMQPREQQPRYDTPRKVLDRWAKFCYNHPPYDEVILWMVGGSKQHYLYEHFCRKWLFLCEHVCHEDTMSTWQKFYHDLDSEWADRLVEYIFEEWQK